MYVREDQGGAAISGSSHRQGGGGEWRERRGCESRKVPSQSVADKNCSRYVHEIRIRHKEDPQLS